MRDELRERLDRAAEARSGQTTNAVLELGNNFTHADQRIDERDIAAIVYSPQTPADAGILPRRKGEIWVQIKEGTPDQQHMRMWVAVAQTGVTAEWQEVAGSMVNAAKLHEANNFTEFDQKIEGQQIVTIKKFITDYPNTSPDFLGQLAMCRDEVSDFVKMYVAYDGEEGVYTWTEITGDGTLGDEVVTTNKVNNFEEYNQTIDGNQILSFINGHEYNPGESMIKPQHDGQFYIAFKTFESGKKDMSIWVAYGNTWIPLALDASRLARLDAQNEFTGSNSFADIRQYIGPLDEDRRITCARTVTTDVNPIADPNVRPRMAGEILVWKKAGSNPVEVAIFMSVAGSTDGSLVASASWRMIWNSISSGVDSSNFAKLDVMNHFDTPQAIGTADKFRWMGVVHRGFLDPTSALDADIMPFVPGEMYIQEFRVDGAVEHKVWMAMVEGDVYSWECIYDSTVSDSSLAADIVLLDNRLDVVEHDINNDLDGMSKVLGELDNSMTEAQTFIDNNTAAINGLSPKVTDNTSRIEALERGGGLGPEFTGLPDRVTTNEEDIAGNLKMIGQNSQRIADLEHHSLDVLEEGHPETGEGREVRSKFHDHDARITVLEERPTGGADYDDTVVRGLITANTDAIGLLEGSVTTLTETIGTVETSAVDSASKIIKLNREIEKLQTKDTTLQDSITTLQSNVADNDGDITDLQGRAGPLETDMIIVKGQYTTLSGRVTALEEHPELPAVNEFSAKKYMIVNETGDGFALSNETTDDVQELSVFALGVQTGDALVNVKTLGGNTSLMGGDMGQVHFASGNVVIGTPPTGTTSTISMGIIQPYQTTTLANHDVREGCVIKVVNIGAGTMNLVPPTGTFLQDGMTDNLTSYSIPSRRTVEFFPAVFDNGNKRYIAISNIPNWIPTA